MSERQAYNQGSISIAEAKSEPVNSVFYYGSEGSYSEQAARKYASNIGNHVLIGQPENPSVLEILNRARDGQGSGVVPIENMNLGAVTMTLLDLDEAVKSTEYPLTIIGEVDLPISHALVTNGQLGDVEAIVTHEEVKKQCAKNIKEFYRILGREIPVITKDEEGNNIPSSKAIEMAAANPKYVAIGREETANAKGVDVLMREFQDNPNNATRFLVFGSEPVECETGKDYKTSMIVYLKDEPGSLYNFLSDLEDEGINLKQLNSYKPISQKGSNGEHGFFMTIDGHLKDGKTGVAMEKIGKNVSRVHLLGSYPKAVEVESEISDSEWDTLLGQTADELGAKNNGSGQVDLVFILEDKVGALRGAARPFAEDKKNLDLADTWTTGYHGVYGFRFSFDDPGEEKVNDYIERMKQNGAKKVARVSNGHMQAAKNLT